MPLGYNTAMSEITLVTPDRRYEKSYLEAFAEFQAEGKIVGPDSDFESDKETFSEYLDRLEGYTQGIGLPEGYVPMTVWWLVDTTTNEWLGRAIIRHRLTEHLRKIGGHIGYEVRPSARKKGFGTMILKLALEKARSLGIDQVLVTCDASNIGSRRIIEKNGGELDSETFFDEKTQQEKLRFWIAQ